MSRELGAKLARWRDSLGLSAAQAAERFDIHRSTLWRIEQGVATPSIETAVNIEAESGIPVSAWLQED